jgi:hypothetical protein
MPGLRALAYTRLRRGKATEAAYGPLSRPSDVGKDKAVRPPAVLCVGQADPMSRTAGSLIPMAVGTRLGDLRHEALEELQPQLQAVLEAVAGEDGVFVLDDHVTVKSDLG